MEYENALTRKSLIKVVALFAAVLSVLILLSWFFNNSRISFTAPDNFDQTATYELVNQSNKEVITFESNQKSFSKRVPRASYEVKITTDNKSYLEIHKTKPFLQTSKIEFSLTPERKREFIGNNPEVCVNYDGKQALSYSCQNELSYLMTHVPATPKSPTYTEQFGEDFSNLLAGGVVNLKNKKVLYAHGFNDLESTNKSGMFFEIDSSLNILSTTEIEGFSDEFKEIKKYNDGFILYGSDFNNIRYYTNIEGGYETLKIGYPKDTKLTPSSLDVYGSKIAAIYSNTEEKNTDAHNDNPVSGKTVVRVYESGNVKEFAFKEGFTSIKLCSAKHLCYINAGRLSVYNIDSNKPKKVMDMVDVKSVLPNKDKVVVEKEKEIYEIDPESKKGYTQYALGDYTSCGINQTELDGYTACVINTKENTNLLFIDESSENNDNIDKKILTLLDQPFISNVSVYKSYVFVVPNVGGLVRDPATGQFIYDPVIRAETDRRLNKLVKDIGLDRSKFNIINTNP